MTNHSTENPPLACVAELEPDIERELLRAYIDSANDAIFVVCDEMKFHVANPLLAQWLGADEAQLTAHGQRVPITEFFGVLETEKLFREQFAVVLNNKPVRFEAEMNPAHGEPRWVEISMNRVRLEIGELVIGIMRDVSERRLLQTALLHHATHDDLTGLINRREFQNRLYALVSSIESGQSTHALVYIDLDQFKVVNDTCGHLAGDELLRQLSLRMQKLIGRRDVLARLGGDEFGLLLHEITIDDALRVADRLCANLAEYRFVWDARSFEVTASVGVCSINAESASAEDVLSAADAACYVAKDNGRNRVQHYFGGVACKGKRQEMEWVSRLHKALEEDRFRIYQQRILDLHASTDAGHFEVLLRLIDEDGAVVAPGRFFPAAERYGLMPAIDRWVIQHLLQQGYCKKLLAVMESKSATHCAINLSGASLNDDRFLEFMEDTLRGTLMAGDRLCFEITETVAVNNFGRIREVMQTFKKFGCKFALDDFGSGMSSFSYLKNLPVDYLKIDGSLVRHIVEDAADYAMVEAIHRVGNVLGLKTIAEFVETDMALQRLREIGVDFSQGYAIHKPEPLFV